MGRINIIKRIKTDRCWKMVSIPRKRNGNYDWKALPAGRYYIEWYAGGKRKRQAAGKTVAQALEVARRKRHQIERRALGIPGYKNDEEEFQRQPLHLAVRRYLDVVEGLKRPNTFRKYRTELERFLGFFSGKATAHSITPNDLNEFMVYLKNEKRLGNNSVIQTMVIVAQFMRKQGRPNLTRQIDLPQKVVTLPEDYSDKELRGFFGVCNPWEEVLYYTFLLTGFREQEVVHLFWEDVKFSLNMIQVKAKPHLGFYPKRSEEREVPAHNHLMSLLRKHPRVEGVSLVFPSPRGHRELHMLDKCKAAARRAELDESRFTLRKFRSTYATRMLQAGFDVRTVQHWMGHKSLETTMRYLAPAKEVHAKLDQMDIAGMLDQ